MLWVVIKGTYFYLSFYKDYHSNKYIKQSFSYPFPHQKRERELKKSKAPHQESEFPLKKVDCIGKRFHTARKNCMGEWG